MIPENEKSKLPRVLVIGAGPSGLSVLRAFNLLQEKQQVAELHCYQKQKEWGGQWNLTWRTNVDENGQPVASSMYENLWTNTPKQCFQFPDYTFVDHFNANVSSYLPRSVFKDYFMQRFKRADIHKFIQFQSVIRYVEYSETNSTFKARIHDLKNNKQFTKQFDFVFVGSGHYGVANCPELKGIQTFPGRILHSRQLRDWKQFKDKTVLLVGGSFSAQDAATQCIKYGAKSATISFRRFPLAYIFPENIKLQPALIEVNQSKCTFKNGESNSYDTIILCTGYRHSYSFLEESLRLKTQNSVYPYLYMGTAFHDNTRLFYIGPQNYVEIMVIFQLQALFARNVVLGKIQLPNSQQRHQHTKQKIKQYKSVRSASQLFDFLGNYMKELAGLTEYQNINIDQTVQTLNDLVAHKREDFINFRDNTYKSSVTGIVSAKYPIRWMEQFDDSAGHYLKQFVKPKI